MKVAHGLFIVLLSAVVVGTFGCEGFTTSEPTQILLPGPPQNLRATALDTSTIKFKWEVSEDVNVVKHYAYILKDSKFRTIDSGTFDPNQTEYIKSDLKLGEVYTLTTYSVSDDTTGPKVKLGWSPAFVFKDIEGEPIRLTPERPGLMFYNELLGTPAILDTNGKLNWDIVIDFTDDSTFKVFLRSPTTYPPYAKDSALREQLRSASFAEDVITGVASVDEIYSTKALNNPIFTGKAQELTKYSSNVGFIVKVVSKKGNQTVEHYAKILFKSANGSIVQGSGENRYVECEVSYQPVPGLPYAGTKKLNDPSPNP